MWTRCALVAVVAALGMASDATAGESGLAHRVSCTIVRYYVAKYTAPTAQAWARSKGATEAEIEAARRCIKDLTTQTAQIVHATQN